MTLLYIALDIEDYDCSEIIAASLDKSVVERACIEHYIEQNTKVIKDYQKKISGYNAAISWVNGLIKSKPPYKYFGKAWYTVENIEYISETSESLKKRIIWELEESIQYAETAISRIEAGIKEMQASDYNIIEYELME